MFLSTLAKLIFSQEGKRGKLKRKWKIKEKEKLCQGPNPHIGRTIYSDVIKVNINKALQ